MVPLYNTDILYYTAITEEPMLYINFIQAAYNMDKGNDRIFLGGQKCSHRLAFKLFKNTFKHQHHDDFIV
jgi:hypothetical protein